MTKSRKKLVNDAPGPRNRARTSLRLAIIGAGRLGTALGQALRIAGYRIEIVVARRLAHARKAARLIDSGVIPISSAQIIRLNASQRKRFDRSNLFLIATPDDVIKEVALQLSTLFKSDRLAASNKPGAKRIALHTSGALSSESLMPLKAAGFSIGSLHPLISISGPGDRSDQFRRAFFSVEGDHAAVRVAATIVRRLGSHSFTVDRSMKPLYHAAAVTASGHVVALFDIALEMLSHCGLTSQRAKKILLPLLKSTLTNLGSKDPAHALTGTFARADASTARRHLAAIQAERLGDALAAYLLLGKRSIELARKMGVNKADLDAIERLLQQSAPDGSRLK